MPGKRVFLHITNKDLIEKGRTRQKTAKPERRTVHPALPSILERPEAANRREELGHKEIDLVVNVPKNLTPTELSNGYIIRRAAIDLNIPLLTNARLATTFINSFTSLTPDEIQIKSWDEYK